MTVVVTMQETDSVFTQTKLNMGQECAFFKFYYTFSFQNPLQDSSSKKLPEIIKDWKKVLLFRI